MKLLLSSFIILFSLNASVMAVPVNINQADAPTIAKSLKGIGLKKAEAIVEYRSIHGNFNSVDQLSGVKGIGKKTVTKLSGEILLGDTPQ